ncbi:MAG TPA: TylF/MycF/NovP-related O-methyltransferase [Candidatus Eremiobacteraceae bacterium]|nr:TylF/MycF/NovP-related O-methyltransferase [Candidatus Eremiobacteraceae bacterium]
MTPTERLYGLYTSVEYIVAASIPGDIVECGVWRGGSCMAVALTLEKLGRADRDLYLYDTFAGMTRPGKHDVDLRGKSALQTWQQLRRGDDNAWCYASLDEVKANMASTAYPQKRIHLVPGDILETIPVCAPQSIAILRLDTDFYETTKHAMTHLFPRLSVGGVLIIDDYGHWRGAKKAIDEYIASNGAIMLLNRLDYSARIGVKI